MSESVTIDTGKTTCPVCGGSDFVRKGEEKELICASCGNVISRKIEQGPEWRDFEDDEESKVRVGMPPTLLMQDKGFSTQIGSENRDASGRRISGKSRRNIGRLRTWQQRISVDSSTKRNLSQALPQLTKLGEDLDIPTGILERAAYLYRMALDKDLIRGRSIDTIIVSALYAALRSENVPKSLKELSDASGVPKKEIARDYRMLVKELQINMPIDDPITYVRRVGTEVGISRRVIIQAEKIMRLAQEKRLTAGKDPMGMAAAAIYFAAELLGVEANQRQLAKHADVTQVTLRNRYQDLKDSLGIEEPITVEELRKA